MESGLNRYRVISLVICFFSLISRGEAHLSDLACGNFRVSGEALYMLSSMDEPFYAFSSSSSSNARGKRAANDQGWHFGYRIEAGYGFCDCLHDITLRWTRFPNFSESDTTQGSPYIISILNAADDSNFGETGEATIRDEYSPFLVDLLFTRKVIDCFPFALSVQGGFQYGYLSFKEEVTYPSSSNRTLFIESRSRMKGVGPEFGLDVNYGFWSCFEFRGRVNSSWLVGEITKHYQDINSVTGIRTKVDNDRYWRLFPTTDVRVGFAYSRPVLNLSSFGCCRYLNIDLEIGYELIAFHKAIDRLLFMDDASEGQSFAEELTLTMNGPYLHAGIRF